MLYTSCDACFLNFFFVFLLAIFEVLPNFDLKKYEFELCKGFFHGKNGPYLFLYRHNQQQIRSKDR